MTAAECRDRFLLRRDRVSHDLVKNVLLAGLQPCGTGEGRFSDKDIVFCSLCGDAADAAALDEVLLNWRMSVADSVIDLVTDVEGKYGFESSPAWITASERVIQACTFLSTFSSEKLSDIGAARAKAEEFWRACDTVTSVLKDIKILFPRLFVSWNPEFIHG